MRVFKDREEGDDTATVPAAVLDDDLSDAEELRRLEEATNPDGTIDATILDWERDGNNVTVAFRHPTEGEQEETMPWPDAADGSHKFERVLASAGLSLSEVDRLRTERVTVPIEKEFGKWELAPSEQVGSGDGHDTAGFATWLIGIGAAPLAALVLLDIGYSSSEGSSPDAHELGAKEMASEAFPIVVGAALWTLVLALLFL